MSLSKNVDNLNCFICVYNLFSPCISVKGACGRISQCFCDNEDKTNKIFSGDTDWV